MIFDEIESAVNIIARVKNYFNSKKIESVATRFIRLFEAHGVHRNQIPRFFGHALTLKDLQDDNSLTAKLDEDMLDAACTLFAVRREWLDGADSVAHMSHDFYKRPKDFHIFINALQLSNTEERLSGELFAPNGSASDAEAILVLSEVIGSVGDEPIYRYHLCNNWYFSYWKARGYLTACVALAWRCKVYVRGTFASKKSINKLAKGEILLGCQKEGVESLIGKKWYPEDMALKSEAFLLNIDPEIDNFGFASSLDLWLTLEEQGFMNIGIKEDAKLLFMQERLKYSSSK